MASRFSRGAVVVVLVAIAASAWAENAWGNSRLAALAARQGLQDEVCVALALGNGRLTPERRIIILQDAKNILTPAEFDSFRQSLDRMSPPPAKKSVVKKTAGKSAQAIAQRKSLSLTRRAAWGMMAKGMPSQPVMPDSAISPERTASTGMASGGTVR